ncbi:MAG: flippase [Candidatus Spechtbacteria bacterium]|nr:flippase [Candidatus Spechtbacteria bacterium]
MRFNNLNLTQRITLNTIAAVGVRVAGGFFALLIVGITTRALGLDGFGEYSTVIAYLSTVGIFVDLGLYTLMTREISSVEDKNEEKKIVSYFFTLRLALAVIFFVLAVAGSFLFPYTTAVKIGIIITSSGYIFLSLSQVLMGVFQKYLHIEKASIAELVGRVVQLIFVSLFFILGGELFAYLWAVVFGTFATLVANIFFARKFVAFGLAISIPYWRKTLVTTLPIAISLLFILLYFKIDAIILSLIKSPRDVGIYSVAYKTLETLIFFPAMFVGITMPILSRAAVNKDEFSRTFQRVFNALVISALPIVVGGILTASSIVNIIGGYQFLLSTLPLQVLFLAVGIIFFGTLAGSSVVALNIQKRAMWIYFLGMVFNVIANLILIPSYSYMAAAWTTVITELIVTAMLFWLIWSNIRVFPKFRVLWRSAPAAIATGIFIYIFTNPISQPMSVWYFILIIGFASAIYGSLLVLFRAITKDDLRLLNIYRSPKSQ